MTELTGDEERRRAFGAQATAVAERFSVERIAAIWERVLWGGASAAVEPGGEPR